MLDNNHLYFGNNWNNKMRNIEEIRNSIRDLIEKAENSVEFETSNHEHNNIMDAIEDTSVESNLSDDVLDLIQLEVKEFQNAFQGQEAQNLIAQSVRETVGPVLDEWLKSNLPVIVREVVEEKIELITKK